MDCGLCGRPDANAIAIVEGVQMNVCERCERHGKVVSRVYEEDDRPRQRAPQKEIETVDDYADLIKDARNKRGMTIKQLAAAVTEKESYMDRIEKGETIPTEPTAKKIERFLNIKLLHEVALTPNKSVPKRNDAITLGDLIEIKRKDKKK